MIAGSAVEAAAKAQYEARYGIGKWGSCPFPDVWRDMVRPGLQAAAMHMLAEAWEAGWKASTDWSIYMEMGGDEPDCDNPYKETK